MAYDEVALRAIAQRRVAERRAFWLDLGLYIIVNVAIWAIWLFVLEGGSFPWPIFVTGGWAIGLSAHGVMTYWTLSGRNDAAIEKEMERLRG